MRSGAGMPDFHAPAQNANDPDNVGAVVFPGIGKFSPDQVREYARSLLEAADFAAQQTTQLTPWPQTTLDKMIGMSLTKDPGIGWDGTFLRLVQLMVSSVIEPDTGWTFEVYYDAMRATGVVVSIDDEAIHFEDGHSVDCDAVWAIRCA